MALAATKYFSGTVNLYSAASCALEAGVPQRTHNNRERSTPAAELTGPHWRFTRVCDGSFCKRALLAIQAEYC